MRSSPSGSLRANAVRRWWRPCVRPTRRPRAPPGAPPRAAFRAAAPDYDAILVRSQVQLDAPALAAATRLIVVGRAGVGVDNVDLEAATRAGVTVVNAPTGTPT